MEFIIDQNILNTIIVGLGLASAWFWIFVLVSKKFKREDLKWWLYVIVPQGILIAFALRLESFI